MTPEEILAHLDSGSLWPAACGLDMHTAYERALSVRELRITRGEQPRGFKIGFTNRNIWPRYNVFAPIWGPVWNTTLSFCEGEGVVDLAGICQPRIEPEAVFGMASTPPPQSSLDQLLACIEWVAPGFEIVQSHRPGWVFTVADTVADGALHARLLVGAKVPVAQLARDAQAFDGQLAGATVSLKQGDKLMEEGVGANVLYGPLHALQHFLETLRSFPGAPDLQAGDVVTTGTWTDAWSVQAGQQWTAEFDEPLSRLRVTFT